MPADQASVFLENRGALVDYATGIVGSRAQAEDVVQEAWLRFDSAGRNQVVNAPRSYLYRIVRNLALDWRRRVAREATIVTAGDPEFASSIDQPSTPEAVALHRNQLEMMLVALAELSERHRVAFEMHRYAGCTLREIGEALDVSTSQAQVLVIEALQHCKQRLRRM